MSDETSWEAKFRTREIASWEWDNIRDIFEDLYIDQGITLKAIRQRLAEEHGFYANETQYKKKIRKWDIQKNLSREKMVAIVRLLDHRTAQGLRTEFSFNSRPLSYERIERSRKRFNLHRPEVPIEGEIQYEIEGVKYWEPEDTALARRPESGSPDPEFRRQPELQVSAVEMLDTLSSPLQEVRVQIHDLTVDVARAGIPTTGVPEQNGNDRAAHEPREYDEFYIKPSAFTPVNPEQLNQASKRRCNDSDARDAMDNRKSRKTSWRGDNEISSDVLARSVNVMESRNKEDSENSSMPIPISMERRGSLLSNSGEVGSPVLGFQVLSIRSTGSPSPSPPPPPSGPIFCSGSPPLPPPERRNSDISLPSFSEFQDCSLLPPQAIPVLDASPPPPPIRGTCPPSLATKWGPGQPSPPAQRKKSTVEQALGPNPASILNDIKSSEPLNPDTLLGGNTFQTHYPVRPLRESMTGSPEDGSLYYTGQENYAEAQRNETISGVANAGQSSWNSSSPPPLLWLESALSPLPPSPDHFSSLAELPHCDSDKSPSPEPQINTLQLPTPQGKVKWVAASIRYSTKSWWDDLLGLGVQAVQDLKKSLGREHPDTLHALGVLAMLYTTLGNDDKAMEVQKYVYDELVKLFGLQHHRTIMAQHNLAGLYLNKGDYPTALSIAEKATEHTKAVHGADHAETLSSLLLIGQIQSLSGNVDEAMQIATSVLQAQQRKPEGVANRHTTISAKKLLGILLEKKGDYQRATETLEEVLTRQEELFGKDHPEALSVMHYLGTAYLSQGNYAESERILRRTVLLSAEKLGETHPDTLSSKHNLVNALLQMRDFPAANELATTVYAETCEKLGEEHLDTARSMVNQASALMGLGDTPGAVRILRVTVDKLAVLVTARNPQVLMVKEKLATGLLSLSRFAEAERVMREVLVERRSALGEVHVDTVRVVEWLKQCREMRFEDQGSRGGKNASANGGGRR
ncbi:TPR-like protein [Choiromyces venosus 120613-1]|uniref:TPR-like protein n=1 Tax=Choiromyces venosus 120613-1 TaxID=1336337 RepID=A0A3N4JBB2_9PEZI|nr:TPR-like protein [Choiromyces venosus 120613-1]